MLAPQLLRPAQSWRPALVCMGHTILSIAEARRVARMPDQCQGWVKLNDAAKFQEPGWVKLEPPRDEAVLFVNQQRERSVVRHPVRETLVIMLSPN